MKPETLYLLKRNLRTLTNASLAQFHAAVLDELLSREDERKQAPKIQGFWEAVDCEPTHGD